MKASANMEETARQMTARGRGILAADESSGTIEKRFAAVGVASAPETRRQYREALFRTQEAMRECISGVILFEETLRQHAGDGTPLVDVIRASGALPGIKVDRGLAPLENGGGTAESLTRGLEGLDERLRGHRDAGAVFAKWRAVFHIGDGRPSPRAVRVNGDALAAYARCCQEAGLVPIVEPEVLMQGEHGIERCAEANTAVLRAVFAALRSEGVALEAMVLKPSMVTPGDACAERASCDEIAGKTLACLREAVPAAVPGIAFLSGGQGDVEATANLNAINAAAGDAPWALTFSFGRALQAGALRAWGGKSENIPAAQAAFLKRARMNARACVGEWAADME